MVDDGSLRKRTRRWEGPGDVRFLTFSCQRRLPLFSNARIAGVFVEALVAARARMGIELFAWVLMPEHVHLLVRPRRGHTVERLLRSLKMSVSRRVLARGRSLDAPVLRRIAGVGGVPRFWQPGGGFDRNLRSAEEFAREVRYIHRNPVERGLVAKTEDWRWSSVRWWMGQRAGEVECDPPPGAPAAWGQWTGFV